MLSGIAQVTAHRNARGPRWHISGTIRPGEFADTYATTPDGAEAAADRMTGNGYYQVLISAPVEYDAPLAEARRIGADLAAARAALADAMQRAEALTPVLHPDDGGVPEAEIARVIGVDRMTIRKWLGKR